jgi:hypothetical protein
MHSKIALFLEQGFLHSQIHSFLVVYCDVPIMQGNYPDTGQIEIFNSSSSQLLEH